MAKRVIACFLLVIISGCSAATPEQSAAMAAMIGGSLQNYGAQRAAYQQPVYQTTLCQRVGQTVMCY